jgi:hypothetical protein
MEARQDENLPDQQDVEHAGSEDDIFDYSDPHDPFRFKKVTYGVFLTNVKWAHYLKRILTELPKLKIFLFDEFSSRQKLP